MIKSIPLYVKKINLKFRVEIKRDQKCRSFERVTFLSSKSRGDFKLAVERNRRQAGANNWNTSKEIDWILLLCLHHAHQLAKSLPPVTFLVFEVYMSFY